MTAGRQLRDDGTTAVLAADTAAHRQYGQLVRKALDQLAASGRHFTADDVRGLLPEGAVAHSPNVLPAVLGAAANSGRIRCVGLARSSRPSRHASRILVWKGVRS